MKNWQNRTVAVRLYLMAGLIGVVVAALVGLGYLQQRHSDEMLTELTEVELQRMQEVSAWQLVSTGTTVRMVALNRSQDPSLAQLFGPEIGPRVDEIGHRYERIKSWAVRPDEVAILKVIDEASPVIIDAMKRIDAARQAGDAAAAHDAFENGFMPPVQRYHEAIDRLAAHQQERLTQSMRASQAHQWQLFWIGAALVVLVVALVAAMVMRLVRYIQRSLDAAVQVAEQVAAGDLVVHMPPARADEFGALMGSLGSMAASLHTLVQQVRQGTARISSVSGGLETGNQNLAERTDQQVTNLQLTAATMDALAATVRQSADSAEEARTLAAHASTVAERGGEVVGRVVQTMEQIEHSSRRIEEIIGVIDGIAFQTNILALNAAVEAARAGEQGRGFAVVAGEVRSLAQRSATAAREIKSLIVASSGNVRTGCSQVEAAGQTMTELVASVQKVSALIGDISSASEEQRLGIDGVTESVNQIDQATQQNAMLVQEAAAAAGQLDQQAAELARAVEAFRLRDTMPA